MSVSARVERLWALAITHTVVWPTAEPDPPRWAAACAAVAAAAEEGSYVARLVDHAARSSGVSTARFLDGDADRFVRVVDAVSRAEFVDLVCADRLRDRELPFAVILRRGGGLALSHSHELGDGRVSAALLESLVTAHDDPDAPFRAPARTAGDGELLAALGRIWWRRPHAVLLSLRGMARRSLRPTGYQLALTSSDRVGASRTETIVLDEHAVAEVERWRSGRPRPPSISMALLTACSRALREHGYPQRQHWQVLVSMRGGDEGLARFGGNLASRVLVDMDSDRDPARVGREITGRVRSGEVLALHMVKMGILLVLQETVRAWRWVRRVPPPVVRTACSTGLSFTDRGRYAFGPQFAARVPRAADAVPEVFTFVRPVMPGIGINVNWFDGRAHLALTFGPSPLDDAAIDGVVKSLNGGVVPLLDSAVRTT